MDNNIKAQQLPRQQGPRQAINKWAGLGASKTLQKVVKEGVDLPLTGVPNKNDQAYAVNKMHSQAILRTVEEYENIKAVTRLTRRQNEQTHYWVPI